MIPGMNPRKMNQMMKKMGMSQVEIEATEVIIRTSDKEFVFSRPQVSKVNMMGQDTYQVVGSPEERAISSEPDISPEDIRTVMEQSGVTEDKARQAIKESKGDLAEAIMSLSQ